MTETPPTQTPPIGPSATGPVSPGRRALGIIREVAQTILIAAVLFVAVRAVVLPYEVDGSSMEPNLVNHERVLVNRQAYHAFDLNRVLNWIPGVDRDGSWNVSPLGDLDRGDVVVLEPPVAHDQPYIKRVIGLPGDHIAFAAGHLLVNGEVVVEGYIPEPITQCQPGQAEVDAPTCELTVPEGHVYVMGDNRTPNGSRDSRRFGVVPVSDLIGEAFFTNWPWRLIGPIEQGRHEVRDGS